ncbi:MAG: sulfotransferase, partial [Cyanobacteria bacterium J06649_11]
MTSPNFLIIGAQKGGTTWLARILTKHPDVFMPAREIEFFSKPETMAKGLDWYEENFKNVLQESAIGEKSPSYIWVNQQSLHEVHRHIHEYSPDIKLIAVLRDPVQRAISHARHYMRGARIGGKVSPLASLDHLILNSSLSKGILSRGHYAEQLEAYYQYFKPEQILTIINEEEIVKDPKAVMARVCNFLEVDASFDFKDADKTV